jgi:uncharacterized damage-inducible protein DinB
MDLKDFFLAQLEREASATRKTIERMPEGRNDWKPHEKSMALGYLAAHIATMPGWIAMMIETDELNLDDPSSASVKTQVVDSKAELLKQMEEGISKSRKALEATTEEHLNKTWSFKMGGQSIISAPRHEVLANAVFAHLSHHRGQLTVYLRLTGASVPGLFGPSADEQF